MKKKGLRKLPLAVGATPTFTSLQYAGPIVGEDGEDDGPPGYMMDEEEVMPDQQWPASTKRE